MENNHFPRFAWICCYILRFCMKYILFHLMINKRKSMKCLKIVKLLCVLSFYADNKQKTLKNELSDGILILVLFQRVFDSFGTKVDGKTPFCMFCFIVFLYRGILLEILCFIISDCKEKEIEAISQRFDLRLKIVNLSCVLEFFINNKRKSV